jgi:NAD(P)-dependent dehydrogenase (short-subunit alcohol dehydrogenase family)
MNRKIAIITGASRGLGANAALKLSDRGVNLILTCKEDLSSVNAVVARAAELGAKAVALRYDAGSTAAVSSTLSDDCRWVNAQRIEASGGIFI